MGMSSEAPPATGRGGFALTALDVIPMSRLPSGDRADGPEHPQEAPMPRMTKTEALKLLQAAYDALDSFDSSSTVTLQCDMMEARHHLRELKGRFFGGVLTSPGLRKPKAPETALTGLETPLPGMEA